MSTLPIDPAANQDKPYWRRYKHQPHWRNNDDEFDAAKLGVWLFLATELLLFSGMFVAYFILRGFYPGEFRGASGHYLNWRIGGLNTVVLLLSSFTIAWGVRNAQLGQQALLRANIAFTALCGAVFLVVKLVYEYGPKIAAGEVPGGRFSFPGGHGYAPSDFDHLFLSIYWVATAIHGFHVLVGVLLLLWLLRRSFKLHFGPRHYTSVETVALYWHLVDLIWIFLFPLLYLVP